MRCVYLILLWCARLLVDRILFRTFLLSIPFFRAAAAAVVVVIVAVLRLLISYAHYLSHRLKGNSHFAQHNRTWYALYLFFASFAPLVVYLIMYAFFGPSYSFFLLFSPPLYIALFLFPSACLILARLFIAWTINLIYVVVWHTVVFIVNEIHAKEPSRWKIRRKKA